MLEFQELEVGEVYYDAAVDNYYKVKQKREREEKVVVEDYFDGTIETLEGEELEELILFLVREISCSHYRHTNH